MQPQIGCWHAEGFNRLIQRVPLGLHCWDQNLGNIRLGQDNFRDFLLQARTSTLLLQEHTLQNAAHAIRGWDRVEVPRETAHGALLSHLRQANPKHFQPMNVNFGLFPPLDEPLPAGPKKRSKREKYQRLADRALEAIELHRAEVGAGLK